MSSLVDNPKFSADYDRLKAISLNPSRHAASNAHEHCEMVHQRAIELAVLNGCTEEEIALLSGLARVHDIGKIAGTANPVESVALLLNYGITDERFGSLHYRCIQNPYQNSQIIYSIFSSVRLWVLNLHNLKLSEVSMMSIGMDRRLVLPILLIGSAYAYAAENR